MMLHRGLTILVVVGALFACSDKASYDARVENKIPGDKNCCPEEEVGATSSLLPETSIYQVESEWHDQNDKRTKLAALRGKTVLLAMIFTNCEYACPQTRSDLKKIEAALSDAELDGVRFLLVSMDSERDVPEVLKSYAEAQGLDETRWTLLHGDATDVRELAVALGVKYKKLENGMFSHSNLISVLDPVGLVVHRQVGLNADPAPTIDAIRRLAKQ